MLLEAVTGDTATTYSARQMRTIVDALVIGSGVSFPTDLAVSQRAAGANFSVDVAAGHCIIGGTSVSNQGKYVQRNTATYNVTLAGAPVAGFTRYDLIYAQVRDKQSDGGSAYDWIIDKVTGTVSGVLPAVPANAIPLAQVGPIVSSTGSITAALITSLRTSPSPVGGYYGRKAGHGRFTSGPSGISAITDLGWSVTVPAIAGRVYEAVVRVPVLSATDGSVRVTLADAGNGQLGTETDQLLGNQGNTVGGTIPLVFGTSGTQTVKARLAKISGGGTVDVTAGTSEPGYLRLLDYAG